MHHPTLTCEEDVEQLLKLLLQRRLLPQAVVTAVLRHLLGALNNLSLQSSGTHGMSTAAYAAYVERHSRQVPPVLRTTTLSCSSHPVMLPAAACRTHVTGRCGCDRPTFTTLLHTANDAAAVCHCWGSPSGPSCLSQFLWLVCHLSYWRASAPLPSQQTAAAPCLQRLLSLRWSWTTARAVQAAHVDGEMDKTANYSLIR